MGETAGDIYESWDLRPVTMPARSTLYPLKPIGVGTAFVESLTSYITRLADAHSVFCGRLIEKVIAPLVPGYSPFERQHGLFRGDGGKSNLANAAGLRALYAVQALEALTLRTDLRHLTLLFLSEGFFHNRGLIHHQKAWCPVCYEEWRSAGQAVYDPLLWVFLDISVCIHHRQRLQTHCPHQDCARSFEALAWRSLPGYCPFCQRWLGLSLTQLEQTNEPLSEGEIVWQQWVTDTLGTTLALASTLPDKPKRERVSEVLTNASWQLFGGDQSPLAQAFGVSISQLGQWMQGEKVPQMDRLLRLCSSLGLSLQEVLFSDPGSLRFQIKESVLFASARRYRPSLSSIDEEYLRQELDAILASNEHPPPSLAEVARRLMYHRGILYQCHSSACSAIIQRHKNYIRQRKEVRMQGHREEIRRVAFQLRSEGVKLTQQHIAPYLAHPGVVRNPEVRDLIEEICRELESEKGAKPKDTK